MSIEVYFPGGRRVNAVVDDFEIKTDQQVRDGGEGSSPEPFTLFLASLATCVGVYVQAFCSKRGIPSGNIKVSMDYRYGEDGKTLGDVTIDIHVPQDFPEKYDDAVINAASLCKVKRHLKDNIPFRITVSR